LKNRFGCGSEPALGLAANPSDVIGINRIHKKVGYSRKPGQGVGIKP